MDTVGMTPHKVTARQPRLSRALVSDRTTGRLLVDARVGVPAYSSSFTVVAAATATDIARLSGSATARIEVTKVIIGGVQTTAGLVKVDLVKRSTANTGGTATTPAAVPHDSADAAASAVVSVYTANPSALGTAVGTVRSHRVPVGASTGATSPVVFDFGKDGKPIVLTGVAEGLSVNLAGATVTGGNIDVTIEFNELPIT